MGKTNNATKFAGAVLLFVLALFATFNNQQNPQPICPTCTTTNQEQNP